MPSWLSYDMCEPGGEDRWIRDLYDCFLGKERKARAFEISPGSGKYVAHEVDAESKATRLEPCDVLNNYYNRHNKRAKYVHRMLMFLCYVYMFAACMFAGVALSVAAQGDSTNMEARVLCLAGVVMFSVSIIGLVAASTFSDHLLYCFFATSLLLCLASLYGMLFVLTRQTQVSEEVKEEVKKDWIRRFWSLPLQVREEIQSKLPDCATKFSNACWTETEDLFVVHYYTIVKVLLCSCCGTSFVAVATSCDLLGATEVVRRTEYLTDAITLIVGLGLVACGVVVHVQSDVHVMRKLAMALWVPGLVVLSLTGLDLVDRCCESPKWKRCAQISKRSLQSLT